MANKDDYLTEYRQFFEKFANTVEPNDQLPVKLGSYKFINTEVVGGIVDWCLQYLGKKSCPSSLEAPLIKTTIEEIRQACKKHPVACGFNPNDNVYEPLKLMQTVMSKMNEVCLRYLDNSQLDTLPAPDSIPLPQVSVKASRNARRRMEDKHVIIHDLNTMFNIQDSSPSSYYAIFDGHAGPDAASYSAAHLHQFIAESQYYPTDPERALKEAFLKTDEYFIEKSRVENFSSGTTAVCALLRPKQQTLYVAWVGDSQALLVNRGKVLQIVKPHKPSREDEKDRIEASGGCVMYWGMWRVNGQLAVSRAIGDLSLKRYVIADPDVAVVPLDGNEEFLIMACDGLWDFVSEDDAALEVYNRVRLQPDNIEDISDHLVNVAKRQGSRDNISVIVIFLKDPKKISQAANKLPGDWGWTTKTGADMDNSNNATNNAFDLFDVFQKRSTGLMDCAGDFKQNGTEKQDQELNYFMDRPTNGKRNADEFDEDEDDFGPETDVDAVDDVLLSPSIAKAKALVEGLGNNNPDDDKMALDIDLEYQRKHSDFQSLREQREETPTPPADSILDSSGIADNVAESGEDSEDEWNYYRVDPKKENSPPIETVVKVSEQEHPDLTAEEMSQLNPDAAEFVPVSPTRSVASPTYNRDLLDDKLLAQSPRRALPMDISVPSPVEFQCEVKQRPSEVFEEFEKHENQNGHQMSSQELMQNFLNGKDINEIEFHPTNYVKSVDDIPNDNYICENSNSNDVLNMSGVMETIPSPIEFESHKPQDENDFSPNFIPNKEQDPMSMSFYQDKDEEGTEFSTNPFDLNKVQMLPDDVEEMSETESKSLDDVKKNVESPIPKENIDMDEAEKIRSPELCNLPVDNEHPAQSPLNDISDISKTPIDEVCEIPKSPLGVTAQSPVCEIPHSPARDECEISKSPLVDEVCQISKSPFDQVDEISKSPFEQCEIPKSPFDQAHEIAKSPFDQECEIPKSPFDHGDEIGKSPFDQECEIPKSPFDQAGEITKSPFEQVNEIAKSPFDQGDLRGQSPFDQIDEITIAKSPFGHIDEIAKSPFDQVIENPKSPLDDFNEISKSPYNDVNEINDVSDVTKSPFNDVCEVPKSPFNDICEVSKSPALEVLSPSVELSSPVGPLSPKSPIPELTELVSPDITASIKDENIIEEAPKSPAFSQHSTATPVDSVLKSPEIECDVLVHQHPDLSHSPILESPADSEEKNVCFSPKELDSHTLLENANNLMSGFVSDLGSKVEEHISEVIEQSTNIIDEISRDAISKVEETVTEVAQEANHFDDKIHEIENLECEVAEETKEQVIVLEDVVKEVERDTANFIGDACKFASDSVSYLTEKVHNDFDEIQVVKGDAENELNRLTNDVEEVIEKGVDSMETELENTHHAIIEETSKVIDDVSAFATDLNKAVDEVAQSKEDIVDDICTIAKETESAVEKEISDRLEEVCKIDVSKTVELAQEANNEVTNTCEEVVEIHNDITNAVHEMKNTIGDFIEEFHPKEEIELVKEEASQIFEAVKQEVEDIAKSPVFDSKEVENIQTEVKEIENSLLEEKSLVPQIEEIQQVIEQPALWKCEYPLPTQEISVEQPIDIKHETITPEFPVPTITSPCEESKGLETPPTTPAVITTEIEMKSPEPQKIVEAVEKLTEEISEVKIEDTKVAAVAAAVAATAAVAAKTAKPKSTLAVKKPLASKASPTSPTKPTAAKTTATTRPAPAKTTARVPSAPAKTAAAPVKQTRTPVSSPKPATATKTTPRPKPATTTTVKPPADKKPLANGDVKAPAKQPPIRRPVPGATTAKPPAEKLSPTAAKPPVKAAAPRPTTAPLKTTTQRVVSASAPKPRPATLTSKTTTTTTSKTTTSTKPTTPSSVKSTSTTTAAKPRTTTTAPKPKTSLSTLKPKAADTEKQIKETANKQLSAAKTTTRTSATSTATKTSSTLKKVEAKVPGAKTTTTRTTTTTIKSSTMGKKPSEVSQTTITKTKGISAKVPAKQNGVVNVIQEITTTTVVVDEPHLIKDNSPVDTPMVIDNSQLLDSPVIAD